MKLIDLYQRVQELVEQGHGEAHVLLDTSPHVLFSIGEIDVEPEGDRVIIWKA